MSIFKKILLAALFLVVFNLNFAKIAAAQDMVASPSASNVNSYELFFPITAGKVAGNSLYFLKLLKENLREMLIFSDLKKSEYNITLSEKRIVESEKLLLDKKDYENGPKTLETAAKKWQQALNYLNSAKEQEGYNNVRAKFNSSLEKQRLLLQYIMIQVPPEQKTILNETVNKLNSIFSQLQ